MKKVELHHVITRLAGTLGLLLAVLSPVHAGVVISKFMAVNDTSEVKASGVLRKPYVRPAANEDVYAAAIQARFGELVRGPSSQNLPFGRIDERAEHIERGLQGALNGRADDVPEDLCGFGALRFVQPR